MTPTSDSAASLPQQNILRELVKRIAVYPLTEADGLAAWIRKNEAALRSAADALERAHTAMRRYVDAFEGAADQREPMDLTSHFDEMLDILTASRVGAPQPQTREDT